MQLNNSYATSTSVQWGSDFLPNIWQNSQSFIIPDISLSHPEIGGRFGARIKAQSDAVTYSPLIIDILLDRDFELYTEIYNNFIEHLNVESGKFAPAPFDMWMSIMGHDGKEIARFEYKSCRVEDISEISLDTLSDDELLVVTLTIPFDYFTYKKITV